MPNYSAQQFIDAIPRTGGVVSAIAEKVGCDWHTAKKWIEDHPTIKRAWEAEKHRITDRARHNVLVAIQDGDLQTSKWWLQVMDAEFVPKQQFQGPGDDGELTIRVVFDGTEGPPSEAT